MSREWTPGDVAAVEYYGEPAMVAVRVTKCPITSHGVTDHWHTERGSWGCHPDTVRPLVVIDPENEAQVERLAAALTNVLIGTPGGGCMRPNTTQAALRSLITPPRPEEPTGLGAVVEDDEGVRYIRHPGSLAPWRRADASESERPWRYWTGITAVRVLSEGVTDAV